jgi:hypothetical protein
MRITLTTDDKGNIKIDTGEKGDDKPALFQSTTDIPVIDGGPAPLQELQRERSVTASASPQEREAELPLNPLRAGAAAAYQDPANLRRKAAGVAGTPAAAQAPSITTFDGGPAKISKDKESYGEPEKGGKRDKKR